MKKLIALAAMALVAFAASCDTDNVGTPPVFFAAAITAPTPTAADGNLHRLENVTFSVAITGGTAPYNVAWNFGGGATPNAPVTPGVAGTTSSTNVQLTAEGTFTASVVVTDANNVTATDSVNYTVDAALNQPPVINSAVYDAAAGTITVSVSDPDDGETLDVTVTPAAGFSVDATTKTAAATGPLTAVFNVTADDFLAGGNGNFTVTVTDGIETVTFPGGVNVVVAAKVLAADTIYAVPLVGSAATGAPVTVLVTTGATANPFQYMVGAGITIESDATYVAETFDTGDVDTDGEPDSPIDGIWTSVGATNFLLGNDSFIVSEDIGGGRERWDFNVTPLGGANVNNATGAMFNAQFTFSAAGNKTFGFQDVSGVKRTYYSDDATEFFWGNFANDGSGGIPNSVTIN